MRDAVGSDGVQPSREAASHVRFAGLVLNLDACVLAHESGEAIPLTHGEFAVLRMFVARPGRVISRDALLDAFANRRFEPFDRSVDVLIGKLRRKIETDPKQPRHIVTVPGEGYRFDGSTQTFDRKPLATVPESQDDQRLAGGGATAAEPPRLSIVVLPFANLGGDPEQEYFADGVTDSLTTDLSRIRGAFVIGRSTAFTYRGKAGDVRQIGRELNVRYVLEGSVQRGGKRLRVNVQLLEAETASHIWAERFDKPVADLFDMQDEIVSRLANALGQELVRVEARRLERKANPDSMDHVFLGRAMCRFLDAGGSDLSGARTAGVQKAPGHEVAVSRAAAGRRALWGFQVGAAFDAGATPGQRGPDSCTRRLAREGKRRPERSLEGVDGRRAHGLP